MVADMNESGHEEINPDPSRDERLVIEFVLGRCDEPDAEQIRRRLETDGGFAALHEGVGRAFSVLGCCRVPDPPEDLSDRTMARIKSARRTEALIAAAADEGRTSLPRFSFRELVALAAAAVVVVVVLVPSLRRANRLADRSNCAANVGAIGTAISHFANGNEDYLPAVPAGDEVWLGRKGRKYAGNSAALFLLIRNAYVAPDVFQCRAAGGQPFTVTEGMTDFPSPQSINYSYQYSLNVPLRRNLPKLLIAARRMAILADATPVFAGGKFHPDQLNNTVSKNHPDGGHNVLYLDIHVEWTNDCRVGVSGDNIWLVKGISRYSGKEKPASTTDTFLLPNPQR